MMSKTMKGIRNAMNGESHKPGECTGQAAEIEKGFNNRNERNRQRRHHAPAAALLPNTSVSL
jgi:hypothetical protein